MRHLILAILAFSIVFEASSQTFWRFVSEQDLHVPEQASRPIRPAHLQALDLDYAAVLSLLNRAPMEFTPGVVPVDMELPTAEGNSRRFRVWESPVMAPELAAKYPEIKTYAGYSPDGFAVRMGTGPRGFHAFMFAPDGDIQTVRPYAEGQQRAYMAYRVKDLPMVDFAASGSFPCGTEGSDVPFPELVKKNNKAADRGVQAEVHLKKYRTAIAAQGEYSAFHGNTKLLVMNAIVEALNFIVPIQERDFAVRLELIPNNDTLIFLDKNTDPYTGTGVGDWRVQNPAATNARVGLNGYDIGHVFCQINPPGGVYVAGQAALSSVCTNNKAAAGSSLPTPIGEGFYLIVIHEMGHQFSATHTFNSCPPAADARTGSTAFEPGGGSTIMSYATTCTPDIVGNRDAYFHVANLEQMYTFVTQEEGSTCGIDMATGNTAPEVNIPLTDGFNIPINTPFSLTGTATDPDGDNLTYCWEQFDLGPETSLGQPALTSPSFRSFLPGASPTRTFPRLQTIISNMATDVEVLPAYSRELNFKLSVRDNHPGAGGIGIDAVRFFATSQAGPFTVSNPNNAADTWRSGAYQVVSWDVANTDKAPVNCKTVNIRLSTDGGLTYPLILASGVPNTGNYCVQAPEITANKARVRVEAADNIFFDISNADFAIQAPGQPAFSLCSQGLADTLCLPVAYSAVISTIGLSGFSDPIALTFDSDLSGAVASFSPNPVVPGNDAVLTVEFPGGHPEGTFNMVIRGNAAGLSDSSLATLHIVNNDFSALALLSPADGAVAQDEAPVLRWHKAPDANVYDIQIASNPSFTAGVLVAEKNNIAVDTFKPTTLLEKGQIYYWRVRPVNECMAGDWVGPFVFATLVNVCAEFVSNDVPKNITASQTTTVESKINVPIGGIISDVNITQIQGNHEYFKDLEMHLISPKGTDVLLFKDKCPNFNGNFNFGFDDSKPALFACPPPNNGATAKPTELLSAFNNEDAGGAWILRVKDNVISSGGKITGFALELCSSAALNPPVLINNNPMSIDPGKNRIVTTDLLKTEDADNTDDELLYTLMTIPANGELQLNWSGIKLTPGDQFTQSDLNNSALRYFDYGTGSGADQFCFTVTDGEGGLIKDCFTIQPVVGTREPGLSPDFILAPNPATETVRIVFGEAPATDTRIRVFDAAGRLLRQQMLTGGQTTVVVNIAGLPEGIYTVTVDNASGSGARRVVVY